MRYSSDPLSKKCHFGHIGGADRNLTFVLQRTAPVTADKSKERRERLSEVDMMTLRELMTDAEFTADSRVPMKKPVFFFRDKISEGGYTLHDGDYKWLRQIEGRKFFLPNMERMYPLSYLQHMSVPRIMAWEIARPVPKVSLGTLGSRKVYIVGHEKEVFGLFPGLLRSDHLVGETPQLGTTFINVFMKAGGDFPVDFRPLGWIHSTDKYWWGRMVSFVLAELGGPLDQVGLY